MIFFIFIKDSCEGSGLSTMESSQDSRPLFLCIFLKSNVVTSHQGRKLRIGLFGIKWWVSHYEGGAQERLSKVPGCNWRTDHLMIMTKSPDHPVIGNDHNQDSWSCLRVLIIWWSWPGLLIIGWSWPRVIRGCHVENIFEILHREYLDIDDI